MGQSRFSRCIFLLVDGARADVVQEMFPRRSYIRDCFPVGAIVSLAAKQPGMFPRRCGRTEMFPR